MTTEKLKTAGERNAFALPAVLCLLLIAATLVVYWPVIHCDFLNYDDPDYFTSNSHVLGGLTTGNIVWAFTTGQAGNWHPLTWLSLMLDVDLFGKGAAGPHITNLLFHLANTVLVFLLLRRLTASNWRSAFVAALFALHPLHVESVAWISERKDVLCAFFGLLALWAYARHAQRVTSDACRVTRMESILSRFTFHVSRFYFLALLFFALGLMSKPMLVTLPLVMLLLDWWPLRRVTSGKWQVAGLRSLMVEKVPFFLLGAISCVVTFFVQKKVGTVATLSGFSISDRVGNTFISYARYLGKTFWPAILANPYPHPGHWPLRLVLPAVALFVGLCVAAVWLRHKHPFVPVGWFWFVGMLVPVIGLVQVGDAALADRYTYLPLIGVFLVLVWGAGRACASWRVPAPLIFFAGVLILAACAWRTRIQLGYWQNRGALFRHALAVTENNYVAYNNLGTWLTRHNVFTEAEDCFRESLRIKPGNPIALYNLGNLCARLGRWEEAIDHYRFALQITPDQADVLNNLGLALTARGQLAEAITNFAASLKLNPHYASAHNNLGTVLLMEHRPDEAVRQFREAFRLAPDNPQVCANLGDVLVRLGQIPEAAKYYEEALRLKPGDAKIEAKLRALGAPGSN